MINFRVFKFNYIMSYIGLTLIHTNILPAKKKNKSIKLLNRKTNDIIKKVNL